MAFFPFACPPYLVPFPSVSRPPATFVSKFWEFKNERMDILKKSMAGQKQEFLDCSLLLSRSNSQICSVLIQLDVYRYSFSVNCNAFITFYTRSKGRFGEIFPEVILYFPASIITEGNIAPNSTRGRYINDIYYSKNVKNLWKLRKFTWLLMPFSALSTSSRHEIPRKF